MPVAIAAQTKETLTLRIASFGSKCDVSDAKFLKKLEACGITDLVNAFATFKNEKELKKTDGAKRQRITGKPPCAYITAHSHTLTGSEFSMTWAVSALHQLQGQKKKMMKEIGSAERRQATGSFL